MGKKNYKQATKKSIYEAKVNQLDNIGSKIEDFIQEETLSVIENICGDFIVRVKENIEAEPRMIVTGKIDDLELKTKNNEVQIIGSSHLIYQDRGVNGSVKKLYKTPHAYTNKMPPVEVFKEWIKTKNIQLNNEVKYGGEPSTFVELDSEKQITKAAWGMAMKVYREGFKPRNIYSKEIPKLIDDLGKEIMDFTVQSLVQVVNVKPEAKRIIIK